MKNSLKNYGFTVVEALVATAIVAVVSLAGVATISQMREMKNRSVEVCRLHANSVIEKFRSVGYFSAISNFAPVGTTRNYSGAGTSQSLSTLGIPDSDLWPAGVTVLANGVAPVLNNNILITSSLNALLAIYNKNASGYCSTNGAPYTSAITAPPSNTELKNASVTLRILPYDTRTGALIGCPAPLRIAPEPQFPDAVPGSAFQPGPNSPAKASRGDSRTNVGLKLVVMENFTNEDEQASRCTAEQNFQYPADSVPPDPPDRAAVIAHSGGPINADACQPRPNSYTLEFGYQGYDMEPGTVLVCRDNSVFYSYNPAPGYRDVDCRNNAYGVNTVMAQAGRPNFIPDPNTPGILYTNPYNVRRGDLSNGWKACDQVTACGVAPSGALTVAGTTKRPRYQLNFQNLPALCRINIEIAALDTASNQSPVFISTTDPGTPGTIDPRNIVSTGFWDVPALTCSSSVACGRMGGGTGNIMDNNPDRQGLYFQCGGCP